MASRTWRAWLGVAAGLAAAWSSHGCNDTLPTNLSGMRCDAQGRCLVGYVCELSTYRCVPKTRGTGGSAATAPLESDAGAVSVGADRGADAGPVVCGETQSVCDGGCSDLVDTTNCNGCGVSAPAQTGRRMQVSKKKRHQRIEQVLPWEESTPGKPSPYASWGDPRGEA